MQNQQPLLWLRELNDVLSLIYFNVDNTLWAVGLPWVREIVRPVTMGHLPNSPDYITGMINVRGEIVPVFNGAELLLKEIETKRTKGKRGLVMLFVAEDEIFGLSVNSVNQVRQVDPARVHVAGEIEGAARDFVGALVSDSDHRHAMLLDAEKLICFFRKNRRKQTLSI